MWQDLYADLKDKDFTVVAVALDTAEAVKQWVEAAGVEYPALIDAEHRLADLYNFVNVPEAAWIDEAGRIVRPPETAGAYEAFRYRDRTSGETPADEMAKRDQARDTYYTAVRDWAEHGAESRFVMSPEDARAHMGKPTPEQAEAHAFFRLGAYLKARGRDAEAARHMARASDLHPASWAMWRQTAERNEMGFAAGEAFWERVDALGDGRYYPPPPMPGMP